MSTLLWIIAGYLALDALLTIGWTNKVVRYTPGTVVLTTITRSFMVVVLVIAAIGGVTP